LIGGEPSKEAPVAQVVGSLRRRISASTCRWPRGAQPSSSGSGRRSQCPHRLLLLRDRLPEFDDRHYRRRHRSVRRLNDGLSDIITALLFRALVASPIAAIPGELMTVSIIEGLVVGGAWCFRD
jgi:hypothetical protein